MANKYTAIITILLEVFDSVDPKFKLRERFLNIMEQECRYLSTPCMHKQALQLMHGVLFDFSKKLNKKEKELKGHREYMNPKFERK
jgi:hypothetical protein